MTSSSVCAVRAVSSLARCGVLLGSLLAGLPAVGAVQVSHTVSVPPQFTDWQAPIMLPQANPAVGVLHSVRLTLVAVNTANTVVENRDAGSRTIESSATAAVTLTDAALAPLVTATPVVSFVNLLEASDGVIDFDAPAGVINAPQTVSAEASIEWTGSDPGLAGFVGIGEIGFGVSALGSQLATGAESYVFGANIEASAAVTVVYTYDDGVPTGASLGDRVWVDLDGDGVDEDGEPGLAGAAVELLDSGGVVLGSMVTGEDGGYLFSDLVSGDYQVRVTPPEGGDWVVGSDPDGLLTPGEVTVSVGTGEIRTDVDFGWVRVARGLRGPVEIERWSRSTGRLFGVHFAVMGALPLVGREGQSVDFGGDLALARSTFRNWAGRSGGRNLSVELSQQLAAFVLNTVQGGFASGQTFGCEGDAKGSAEIVGEVSALLAANPVTTSQSPARSLVRRWTRILEELNEGEESTR